MLKSFYLTGLVYFASNPSIAVAVDSPLLNEANQVKVERNVHRVTANTSQSPGKIYVDEPVCYVEMSDGKIIDLSSLCGKAPNSSVLVSYPRPPKVYDTATIKKFDQIQYGE